MNEILQDYWNELRSNGMSEEEVIDLINQYENDGEDIVVPKPRKLIGFKLKGEI